MSSRVTWVGSSQTPWIPSSWTFHGPVSRRSKLSSGASLLLRDDVPGSLHYAFIGTVNTAGALYSATSTDLINWTTNDTAWQRGRPGHFDHNGIAAGPQAERLSDGNYLYLYNIDNAKNCQSASCGPCGVTIYIYIPLLYYYGWYGVKYIDQVPLHAVCCACFKMH